MARILHMLNRRGQRPITDNSSPVPVSEQLRAFRPAEHGPVYFGAVTVDGRTGTQWLKSVEAYLEWRTGSAWRPLTDRWNPDRWYYLDGLRFLHDVQHGRVTRGA